MTKLEELQNRLSAVSPSIHLQITSADLNHPHVVATRDLLDTLQIQQTRIIIDYVTASTSQLSISIMRGDETSPVEFLGTPSGYELETLIMAMESQSGIDSGLDPLDTSVQAVIKSITRPLRSDLFVSPTCAPCARMAHLVITMAHVNDHLRFRIIQADQFPDLGRQHTITSTPTLIMPGHTPIIGNVPPAHLAFHLWQGAMNPA